MITHITQLRRLWRGTDRERGIALPLAMIITILVMIVGLALLEISRMDAVHAMQGTHGLQAVAAGEFGLGRAVTIGTSQNVPWTQMRYDGYSLTFGLNPDPLYNGHQTCELFTDEPVGDPVNATYTVVIEDLNDSPSPTRQEYRIHSFGTTGTRTQHVTLDAMVVTFSSFAWFSNNENNKYFRTGDELDGWLYTNDHLNIAGSPEFGRVMSADSYVNYLNGGPPVDDPDFQGGLALNQPLVDINTLLDDGLMDSIRAWAAEPTGIWLGPNDGEPYHVQFSSSGHVTIKRELEDGGWEKVVNNVALSDLNGVIYIEEHTMVRGDVDGEIIVATSEGKDIRIRDNLIYAYPGDKTAVFEDGFDTTNPAFDDRITLVAGRDVVADKSWSQNWGDLYVMASIITVNGSFKNRWYDRHPRKTLHLYGSIWQDTRGAMGTNSGNGFLKDYKFDQRFLDEPLVDFSMLMYDYGVWNLNP